MNTLERLKELATVISVWPCRVVTFEFNDETGDVRYVVELPGVKLASFPQAKRLGDGINALPDLIAVVEAAVKYISKRVEYAGYERQYEILKRVENKTTMQEMEMSTVDAERERAELELCDAWDNLNAALAKLEAPHED